MTESHLPEAATPVDRFRAIVTGDPDLQLRLSAFHDPEAFAVDAIVLAAERGIALTRDDLLGALRHDPLGLRRFSGAPCTGAAVPVGDWLPTAVVPSGAELGVDWVHFGGVPLAEPFFEDSMRMARARPLNRLVQHRTPLATIVASLDDDSPVPDGFVFHLSRCGSTLVAQMFAADPRNIVVSEAPPIDSVVQLATARIDVPIEERIRLLRAVVGALGRRRIDAAGAYVVKLDSWHTFALPLFRLAFPDTPWIFLYREPVEILVSHVRMAGMQTVPGAMGFDPYGIERGDELPHGDYAACALGRTAEAVVEHFGLGGGLLVNYAELPGAMEARILPHFGIRPDAAGRAAMADASRRDAKAPTESFTRDTEEKQRAADDRVRAQAATYMDASFRKLEDLRLAGET